VFDKLMEDYLKAEQDENVELLPIDFRKVGE
jgi:hypothetical protein